MDHRHDRSVRRDQFSAEHLSIRQEKAPHSENAFDHEVVILLQSASVGIGEADREFLGLVGQRLLEAHVGEL